VELGEVLKEARVKSGLSLIQVQENTKIRKKYLQAIEENNFDVIPGSAYVKVFVKGYAREVGIDYQMLLDEYDILKKVEVKEADNENFSNKEFKYYPANKKKNTISITRIILTVIIILIISAAAFYGYKYFFTNNDMTTSLPKNSESLVETTQQVTTSEGNIESNSTLKTNEEDNKVEEANEEDNIVADNNLENNDIDVNSNTHSESKPNNTDNEDSVTEIDNENSMTQVENENLITVTEEETQVVKEANNISSNLESESLETQQTTKKETNIYQGEQKFIVKASDISWVRVIIDEEVVFEGILNEGEEKEFVAEESIQLKVGNGHAISIENNNKTYGPWGGSGSIVEEKLIWSEEGISEINLRDE